MLFFRVKHFNSSILDYWFCYLYFNNIEIIIYNYYLLLFILVQPWWCSHDRELENKNLNFHIIFHEISIICMKIVYINHNILFSHSITSEFPLGTHTNSEADKPMKGWFPKLVIYF